MEHKIDLEAVQSPQGEAMSHAISTCVHCGFCLPACPTYQVLGEEMDSPRGRIMLMRGVLEETLPLQQATPYLDRCLGCMGCVTACPSGVPYGELITSFRSHTESKRSRPVADSIARTMASTTLPYPNRFRWAARLGRLAKPIASLFPSAMKAMLGLVPARLPPAANLPPFTPAIGTKRGRVGLLSGCVQQAIAPEINAATIRVLARYGFEVIVPPSQGCCGSLLMHTGQAKQARQLAAQNLDLFDDDLDAIITNAAGCGSGIREYELLFRGEKLEQRAASFSKRVQDVSQFLASLDPIAGMGFAKPLRIAYHDACHLAHAQGISSEPRQLLSRIPGVELVEIPDGEICCGSAGTYNIEQPAIASTLGKRKAENILKLEVDAVVMGNIGCMVQIRKHLLEQGVRQLPIYHTIELLDRSME